MVGRRSLDVNGTDIIAVRSSVTRSLLDLGDVEYRRGVPKRAHGSTSRNDCGAAGDDRYVFLLLAVCLGDRLNRLTVSVTECRVVECLVVSTIATTHFSNKIK